MSLVCNIYVHYKYIRSLLANNSWLMNKGMDRLVIYTYTNDAPILNIWLCKNTSKDSI